MPMLKGNLNRAVSVALCMYVVDMKIPIELYNQLNYLYQMEKQDLFEKVSTYLRLSPGPPG